MPKTECMIITPLTKVEDSFVCSVPRHVTLIPPFEIVDEATLDRLLARAERIAGCTSSILFQLGPPEQFGDRTAQPVTEGSLDLSIYTMLLSME